jgi:hypothetical protein
MRLGREVTREEAVSAVAGVDRSPVTMSANLTRGVARIGISATFNGLPAAGAS